MRTYRPNKEGKLELVLPAVRIGHERLNNNGPSRLSGSLVACEEHGTVPCCWVHNRGILIRCCRKCIEAHCQLTKACLRPNWDADAGMDHPDGHSY
jgi:hypothetical protein